MFCPKNNAIKFDSKLKLVCLPYAGGSSTIYSNWKNYLHPRIELNPIELAGRGKRFSEPFYHNFSDAVDDVYRLIKDDIDYSPYAFFGHSMGSILAFELANKIRGLKHQEPIHLFLSGRYPPHLRKEREILHKLPDNEFGEEILKKGGTPKEFFSNVELVSVLLPVIKADYRILETYEYFPNNFKFEYDISVFGGQSDIDIPLSDLNEWRLYTNKECKIYEFRGGHFFIHEEKENIVKIINHTLINIESNISV
jgi:medium-chain acyl-[acyl-carrier-protein] hydrolase